MEACSCFSCEPQLNALRIPDKSRPVRFLNHWSGIKLLNTLMITICTQNVNLAFVSEDFVTVTVIVMEDFTKYLDERQAFDVFYLDFSKAFDSVPHLRLFEKCKAYNIMGNVLN